MAIPDCKRGWEACAAVAPEEEEEFAGGPLSL